MAIKSGETTFYQAKRGIVQNGLVLNLDAGVDASYDGGTTWRDLKGSNNGTLTNSPTFDKTNGGSIVFDGTNEYVSLSSSIVPNGDFTLTFWININSVVTAGGDYPRLFASNGDYMEIAVNSGGGLRYYKKNGGGWQSVYSSLSTSSWIYIVYVRDGSDDLFYVGSNNVFTSSGGVHPYNVSINGHKIGIRYSTNLEPFGGDVSVFTAYLKALTAAEVLQNYNATRHRFGV